MILHLSAIKSRVENTSKIILYIDQPRKRSSVPVAARRRMHLMPAEKVRESDIFPSAQKASRSALKSFIMGSASKRFRQK
jgi:hypothetical protein